MNPSPYFFFDDPPDTRPVRILTGRPMLLLRTGETLPRHTDPGELVVVTMDTLRSIPPDSIEIIGEADPAIVDHRDS